MLTLLLLLVGVVTVINIVEIVGAGVGFDVFVRETISEECRRSFLVWISGCGP